jgi:poly(beta-D-mannuronate) lyase
MTRLLLLSLCLAFTTSIFANTIIVKTLAELNAANKSAKPGDIVILQNGEWKDVKLALDCMGTEEKPIIFKAEAAGKVIVTGYSSLKLGGAYIIVEGLYFTNGFAGNDAVIDFRVNKNKLAIHCRVTNCVINDFNNPRRMDENNWVLFYGKNNRLDHNSFLDKKNMGVLLAVILDDERSRENYHSIDSNYFGKRIPLASNGGEIMRVGVSQHCQFNSNTIIRDNFFEHCDGETEIVSIKSGSNIITGNTFKESQGSVVLRHGDNNIVTRNIFLGNDKTATGGVRVINKGQVVQENLFYRCRGTGFRSPLAVMNGIPNSPAHRYVQVIDARIDHNIFYECSPLSFGEGSDTERTLAPDKVMFANNIFYNTRDSNIYKAWDDLGGFQFASNRVNPTLKQSLGSGFNKTNELITEDKVKSLKSYLQQMALIEKKNYAATGASWFSRKSNGQALKPQVVNCATANQLYEQLATNTPLIIKLTGKEYVLDKPLFITKTVQLIGNKTQTVKIKTNSDWSVFVLSGNGNLSAQNLSIDGSEIKTSHFICSDSTGSSNHYNLSIQNCSFKDLTRERGCQNFFYAYKSILADSIIIRNNTFTSNNCNLVMMTAETDNKGYYNVERIAITGNTISKQAGILLSLYRGGNDESTLGPDLRFSNNKLAHSNTAGKTPLIRLYGVQQSALQKNNIVDCNKGSVLVQYEDIVRATHLLSNNTIKDSGKIITNKFVVGLNNSPAVF